MPLDTAHGLQPDGCSGYAQGTPARWRLLGLPGPKRR
jgi:hypothetical protein